MHWFSSEDAQQLLHNKFVVVLGDSIQRSVYKDLVKLLKEDDLLSDAQIKGRGELEFEKDTLVEGGMLTGMHNGTTYREVRQYRTGHHLVRFYFLTRVYSDYLESILSDFKSGPQPDVVIVNSCVWDLLRYYEEPLETYKTNLDILFRRLKVVLGPQCLLLWTMTMPVGYRDYEMPENVRHNLRGDIMEGNLFGAVLADFHRLDVLDMHYHFRWNLHLRWHDAVHWNQIAHRKYTQILLIHIAQAWGVEAPKFKMPKGFSCHPAPPHLVTLRGDPYPGPYPTIHRQERCNQAPFPFGNDIPQMPNNMTPGFFGPPGFNGHFAPPHQFALRGDPYPGPHPSIQEQERCNQAPFPFGTDNPLLTANIGPGFFSPQGEETDCSSTVTITSRTTTTSSSTTSTIITTTTTTTTSTIITTTSSTIITTTSSTIITTTSSTITTTTTSTIITTTSSTIITTTTSTITSTVTTTIISTISSTVLSPAAVCRSPLAVAPLSDRH